MDTKTTIANRLRDQLNVLEVYLPANYANVVYERLNESYACGTIKQVRNGNRENIKILSALVNLAREEQKEVERALKKGSI